MPGQSTTSDPDALDTRVSPLGHLKVVDLTTELGALAVRMLSGFGAHVVRIESPQGDPLRRRYPTTKAPSGDEVSLYWLHMMARRTVECLDMKSEGQKFVELLSSTDIVLESQPVGWLESIGLDFEEIHRRFPRLIWTSVTPFGREGPRSTWAATDLTGVAAGGLMSLCGDPDRPPLRPSVEQGYAQAGIVALAGTLAALHMRNAAGQGQMVDVSMQEAVSNCLGNSRLYFEFDGVRTRRAGGSRAYDERGTRLVYPCADGYVAVSRNTHTPGLMAQWMRDAGHEPNFDADEWAAFPQAGAGMASLEKTAELERDFEALFAAMPKMTLYEEGQRRGIMICPVSTPGDLFQNQQLVARGFFDEHYFPELEASFKVPGPPARASASAWDTGTTESEVASYTSSPPFPGSSDSHLALQGIRVADFSWVGVGPLAAQSLGLLGAEVIHVETATRLDGLRMAGPRRSEGPDAGAYFANFNRDKLGMTLNLHAPGAREVALRLVRESDILLESFRPGFMESVGLSYEEVRAANPDIIMMSCSMEGASGPHSAFKGFGLTLQSTVGFTHFTGWPDRPPVGTGTAYTDWFAASVASSFLLASIERRRRTGRGEYIDLSQLEACIWALDAEVLRYTATGIAGSAMGNRHPEMAPHGVFPCRGDDKWIAISVRDDDDWNRFAGLIPDVRLNRKQFRTLAGRKEAEDEIEEIVREWTATCDRDSACEVLQAHGVPAYPVNDMSDVQNDAQLMSRGHFWHQQHPVIGNAGWDAPAFRLLDTPLYSARPAPLLGQDNAYVYGQVLAYSPSQIAELTVNGVLD